MSKHSHAVLHVFWWSLRTMGVLLAALVVGCVLYANVVGLPDAVSSFILARLNRGGVAFDIGSARLAGVSAVLLEDACIYRKQVLGAPMLEASSVRVCVSPMAWLQGRSSIVAVFVDDAVLRPLQSKAGSGQKPARLGRAWQFKAEVKNCRLYDIVLERTTFDFEGVGQTIHVSNLEALVDGNGHAGRVAGQLTYDMAGCVASGRLVTNLDPNALSSVYRTHQMSFSEELTERFAFPSEPPRGEWRFDQRMGAKGDLYVVGDFRMRDCTYRGVELMRADGSVTVNSRGGAMDVTVNDLLIVRREGMARVGFTVTSDDECVDFEAETSLQPLAMARMVNIMTNVLTRYVTFDGATTVTASGVVDYGGTHAKTDLKGTVQADNVGLDRFECDSASCDVRMVGDAITLTNIEASVYGGTARGTVGVTAPGGLRQVGFETDIQLWDADFKRFMKHASTSKTKHEYTGHLSGGLALEGKVGAGYRETLEGGGSIKIRDGRVFLLPVFGGLSRLMTRIIPGLDFVLRQSDASMRFRIRNGRVETDKVVVEGDILSLKGKGAYELGGDLDFGVQVKLMKEHTLVSKLVRAVTYPVSKLFEFRLRGTLDDPRWYPVNFSLDLLERIGLRKRASSKKKANSPPPTDKLKDSE